MSEQGPGLLLTPTAPEDGAFFEAHQNLPPLDDSNVSSRLMPSKAHMQAQHTAFIDSGRSTRPNLTPVLDPKVLDREEEILLGFKDELDEIEGPDDIRQLYHWRTDERVANVRIARAAHEGDMDAFDTNNHFIYGAPDGMLFRGVAGYFAAEAERTEHEHHVTKSFVKTVRNALDAYRIEDNILEPDPVVFDEVRRLHFQKGGYYPLLLAGIDVPDTDRINQAIGDPIIGQVIANLGSTYQLAPARGITWSLNHDQEQVLRPEIYKLIRRRFIGLAVGHEVGQHLGERMNGLRSSIRLSADGFDRYETGSEGHALIREQVLYETFGEFAATQRWQIILRRYLSTAMALGQTGQKTFPEVFDVVNAIDRVYEISKTPDDVKGAKEKADSRSWQLLGESIYKGTDGTLPYRRYGIYLPGNVAYWNVAKRDPRLIAAPGYGKFDLTNDSHRQLIDRYGMLPKVDA